MKSIIPYTKEISFGSKIAEITSMSLEHELEVGSEEVSGNFIISGDYKTHEVSVNREPFLYKLPFSMELTDQIDLETLKFEITDFSYELTGETEITVHITFAVEAMEKEVLEDPIEEEPEEEPIEERSLFEKVDDPIADSEELTDFLDVPVTATEEVIEIEQIEETEIRNDDEERDVEMVQNVQKVENLKESEETIIKNVNPTDDSFATYHIHIVKEGENVETICTMYHSNLNLLGDYNDMANITVGDKVIIPDEDE